LAHTQEINGALPLPVIRTLDNSDSRPGLDPGGGSASLPVLTKSKCEQ